MRAQAARRLLTIPRSAHAIALAVTRAAILLHVRNIIAVQVALPRIIIPMTAVARAVASAAAVILTVRSTIAAKNANTNYM